ncbi:transcriptional regulator domain-containing protein [Sphingobium baderi]|uniref:Transcriptional regulator-like domain-containing protein n=1 Tax=Sphingobium baderi TaxID=1332080 RepID=A0A0S3EZS1_9SPHN|nr:DUF6499 domain-containing protein [Sphingobium baderi]ALR20944.1 hypothetical protein ATN00_12185 [Sphingobium baderi]
MPTASDWRSQAIAEQTADLDYADFAQEFLRYNADYRREYDDMACARTPGAPGDADCTAFARRWGLVFPF